MSINSGDPDEHPHLPQSSWLHNVKGRIAKTVEEKKREYSELKAERELRRQILLQQQAAMGAEAESAAKREAASLHGSMDGSGSGSDEKQRLDEFVRAYEDESACLEGSLRDLSLSSDASTVTISHSVSESKINESGTVGSGDGERNNPEVCSSLPNFRSSQSFDEFMNKEKMEKEGEEQQVEEDLKTPLLFETEEPDSKGASKGAKERRRFTFFSSRSANVTPKKEEFVDRFPASEPNPTATVSANSVTATPTRATLRERVMGFMGKTPTGAGVSGGRGSLTLTEDPFSMSSLEPSPVTEENSVVEGGGGTAGDDDEDSVEEAVEADELLVYDPASDDASEPLHSDEADVGGIDGRAAGAADDVNLLSQYWWLASLPVCAVILVQFLPLPSWALGFLSGIVLSAFLIAFWKFFKFVRDPDFGTKFIENVRKKLPNKPAIIVQEELERQYVSFLPVILRISS